MSTKYLSLCRLETDAGGKRQAPSDNQTPAHCCRPVHTGAISKRLASVTRRGSLLERFIAWRSVNKDVICMLGMGCPGIAVSRTRSFTAHLSLQCVYNLTRRKRLVNACRLPPASVCNRHKAYDPGAGWCVLMPRFKLGSIYTAPYVSVP